MRLTHYSDSPLVDVFSVEQKPRVPERGWSTYDKPSGLWVSANGRDDWPSWCRAEGFRNTGAQHATRVHLREDHCILIVRGREALLSFTRRYGIARPWRYGVRQYTDVSIDWSAVASEYGGIIIAPYVWSCRLDRETDWYYTWDCASGCIWDADQIARLDLRFSPPRALEIAA